MADTSIEWTDATWNPVAGCSVISPGCTNCYAMRMGGGPATSGSSKLDGATLRTKALKLSFLCVDSSSVHQTGAPLEWKNPITLKHRIYQSGASKCVELRAAPQAAIHYTTDGSDPKLAGAVYEGDILLSRNAPVVLAYAERDGIESGVERIPISWDKG